MLKVEMQTIEAQQDVFEEQQKLLLGKLCADHQWTLEEQQQALVQQNEVKTEVSHGQIN